VGVLINIACYSDLDIVVDCAETIPRRMQKKFLMKLKEVLANAGISVQGYARIAIAVTFDCEFISFDLLFSEPGKWCPVGKAKQLKESGTSILFITNLFSKEQFVL
jgi:hypothetical protein